MEQRIFDIHVHIFPDGIAERASNAIADFYNGFDVAAHAKGSLEDCIEQINEANTTMFAAHSVAVRPHSAESICRFIMAAHDLYPDRIIPFAAIHPDQKDLEIFAANRKEEGFRGFKIHPDMQRFCLDGKEAEPMMKAIENTGLPVLIHCGDSRYDFDGPERVLSLHRKIPGLKMIAAHFGGWLEWDQAVEILPDNDIMVDLSSSLYKWPTEKAAKVIRRFGVKNIFYGSDYPMWTPSEEMKRFMQIPLTEEERSDILWNNASRLFNL